MILNVLVHIYRSNTHTNLFLEGKDKLDRRASRDSTTSAFEREKNKTLKY